jgi:hypothetical protein
MRVPKHKNVEKVTEVVTTSRHRWVFKRDKILEALRLPPDTELKFGGKEWEQVFDDDAQLEATCTTTGKPATRKLSADRQSQSATEVSQGA